MGDEWEKLQEIRINGLRAQVAERDELIAQVTKILGGYPDSDLLSLATTVAAGYERWSDGHDAQVDELWKQLDQRDKEYARLQERLAAVPVAQLRRQYSIEPMTVHDFGLDAQDVDAWLRSH